MRRPYQVWSYGVASRDQLDGGRYAVRGEAEAEARRVVVEGGRVLGQVMRLVGGIGLVYAYDRFDADRDGAAAERGQR